MAYIFCWNNYFSVEYFTSRKFWHQFVSTLLQKWPQKCVHGIYILNENTHHLENCLGWSGGAKVSCILCHLGVHLILAYSWARPVILVAGKGRGGMFLFLLFLYFHSCSSFFPAPFFHFRHLFYLFLPFSGRQHKMTNKGWHVIKLQPNQSIWKIEYSEVPALMAQLDECPAGDQEVVGLDLSQVRQHSFIVSDHEIFSPPSADLRRAIVSFWQKRMCTITG